jgi:hypothetical protein
MQTVFIVILALSVVILGSKVREYSLFEKQRNYILFCTASEELFSNSDLLDIINSNNKMFIKDDERDDFFIILRAYQFHAFKLFASKALTKDKQMLSLPREEFFVTTFKSFLNEHSTDSSFWGNELMRFQRRIDSSTSEYHLTDFGLIYYKALYATFNYEEQHGIIQKGSSDYLLDAITTSSVQITRYIP